MADMNTIILFAIILFANWSMDSIKHRYRQSIFYKWRWLRETKFFGYREFWRADKETSKRKFVNHDPKQGRKKLFGITLPPAIFDGWHFWKSIMVGGIIALASQGWLDFIAYSIAWNLVWWMIYDLNYDTGDVRVEYCIQILHKDEWRSININGSTVINDFEEAIDRYLALPVIAFEKERLRVVKVTSLLSNAGKYQLEEKMWGEDK